MENKIKINKKDMKEFRKDFKKCVKALLSYENQEVIDDCLNKLSKHIKNQKIYQDYYKVFVNTLDHVPDEGKMVFENIFNQGINVGMILTLGAILNNTGYLSDCVYDENEEEVKKIKKL